MITLVTLIFNKDVVKSVMLEWIQNFTGPMGSLVVLMFWIYYTVEIILVGAECATGFEGRKEIPV